MTTPLLCGYRSYVTGVWGQVHVRQWGKGRPLILLHQTPWNSMQFYKLAPVLATAGWRVIAPDTPGYGLSDAPTSTPSVEQYGANLEVVLDALDIPKAAIGGHHTGALIAAAYAALNPGRVEALILDNPPLYNPEERRQRQQMPHRDFAPTEGGAHYTDRWDFMRQRADPNLSTEHLHLANVTYYMNDIGADHGHAAAYEFDLEALLPLIVNPTLLLSNSQDPISDHAERFLKIRPNWQIARLDGGSANILEQPKKWSQLCHAFLKGLSVSEAG